MKPFAFLLPILLLAACSNSTAPAPADGAAAAPTAASTPSAAAEAAAASAAAAAGATAAPADAATAPAPADAVAAATAPAAAIPGLVAGTDYIDIPGGRPFEPRNGKVEVVEVFGYICPFCARFQPLLRAWEKKLPADVRLTFVPAAFGPQWTPYARAFYVSDSMGLVPKTHDAVYNAIHLAKTLPGEGQKPDEQAIGAFYAKYGADPKVFVQAMQSFAIDAKLARAKQFAMDSGVEGTPTLIVNGKYRVRGKDYPDMLRITDALIAQERATAP